MKQLPARGPDRRQTPTWERMKPGLKGEGTAKGRQMFRGSGESHPHFLWITLWESWGQ